MQVVITDSKSQSNRKFFNLQVASLHDFGILRNALRRKFYVFQDFHVSGTQETGLPKSLLLFNTDCIVVTDPVLTFPETVVVYLTLAFHPF